MNKEKKGYIAQFGTFDVKNYGDLLFPEVLKNQLSDYHIHMFSPIGGTKPFSDDEVFACSQFETMSDIYNYKAVIIGGGDLIRLDNSIASDYRSSVDVAFEIWQTPCLEASKKNIPIIFNGVGVPFPFRKECQHMVKFIFDLADYISVRDDVSRQFLADCGVKNVKVIPDTVFSIKNIYSQEDLKSICYNVLRKYGIEKDDRYLVFHHNIMNINDENYINYLYDNLSSYSQSTDIKIIFMPIGYVHNDIEFLNKLYSIDTKKFSLIEDELDLIEMTSVLACSAGYVGTSMHGAIVSLSYGKFAICMNDMNLAKINGLYQNIGKIEWNVKNKYALNDILVDATSSEYQCIDFENKIEEHFNQIRSILQDGTNKKYIDNEILNIYYQLALRQNDKDENLLKCANVFFDYGQGYSETNKQQIYYSAQRGLYKLKIEIPGCVVKVRIDPIENNIINISNLVVELDGVISEYTCGSEIETEIGKLLLSLDPCFEVTIDGQRCLELSFSANILKPEQLIELFGKLHYDMLVTSENIKYMEKMNQDLKFKNQDLNEKNQNLNINNEKLCARVSTLETEIQQKDKQVSNMISENEKKKEQIIYIQERINNLNAELDKRIEECNALQLDNQMLQAETGRLNNEIAEAHNSLRLIQSSTSWKLTKPIRGIKNLIRKIFSSNKLFRHIWRALGLWKHHGFSVMRQECKQYRIRKKNGTDVICATSEPVVAYSNNKDGYVPYDSEYQDNIDFSMHETMVKMLAFYLPQYHTFKENDEWWGEGFTEWVNVRKGEPRFDGHYQPRVPHKDIGYYSLEDIDTLKKQAKLAKQHGIYGFCFYYYWFSGKRLMEKPVDMLLEHPEIDLPFCLCWANENWTRTWDGQAKNVLIGQEYSYEDDELFIKDIKKYVDDPRYIRIDGKPVIIVYNPGEIPDCEHTFKQWRRYAKEYGIGDILLWTCQTANHTAAELNIEDYIDAEVEFPPHNTWKEQFGVRDVDLHGGSAFIYNYDKVVDYQIEKMEKESDTKVPIYRCCTMGWDNSARRKQNWFAYYGYSLKSLYKWVTSIVKTSKRRFEDKECFAFINAWNEWGEGTYLDPDCRFGYANINTVSKALFELPLEDRFVVFNDSDEVKQCENLKTSDAKIAVQIHMFYLDTMEEIVDNLNKIPYTFDCYISTDTEEKKKTISTYFDSICKSNHCQVDIIQNRGRDVAPFLKQMKKVYNQYEYICHIHSKKTRTNDHGNEWRTYIFDHLFGNEKYLSHIFAMFEENPKLGIVMPETYPVLEYQAEWGGNREGVAALLHKMGIDIELPELPVFPVGDMFWMRSAAVKPIFDLDLSQADFPEEAGQVNATIAHQIERVWVYLAKSQGYDYVKVFNNCSEHLDMPKKKRIGIYVHYDKANIISADDEKTVAYFSGLFEEFHFVTNSKLAEEELGKIRGYVQSVTCRENIGLDFGGWKQKLLQLGREYVTSFDEVVLLNNSFYKPVYDIKKMFNDMSNRKVDFWGVTIFPYSPDGSYIQKPYIPEHLQSYFMVFHDSVIQSDVFWGFWEAMPEYESFIDVVANCESQFTRILADAGFRYEPYIKETYYISKFLNNYRIPYEKPVSLVLLKDPFIKKKCTQYMDEMERIKLIRLTEELQA